MRCSPLVFLALLACKPDATSSPAGRFAAMGTLSSDDTSLLLVGGATTTASSGPLQEAWRLDLDSLQWSALTAPPEALCRGTAVAMGEQVHIFGGSTTGWGDVDWLWTWDLTADSWTEHSATGPAPRFKHAAVAWDEAMIVVGGRNNDGDEDVFYGDVWSWDPGSDTWREIPTTGGPAGIHRHELVADPDLGLIWVHGGFQPPADDPEAEPERSDRLWQLDPDAGTWTELTWTGEGPPIRASHSLTRIDGALLVWGGNATDESAWTFDLDTSTWTEHPATPAPLARDSMVTGLTRDGSRLLLAGGDPVSEEVPNFVMDVWSYEVADSAWTELIGIEP